VEKDERVIARQLSENARNWIGASLAAGGPFAVSTKKEIDLTEGIAYGYVPESARAE
jgi:hypothetical protein